MNGQQVAMEVAVQLIQQNLTFKLRYTIKTNYLCHVATENE